jgi:hypothetical protein
MSVQRAVRYLGLSAPLARWAVAAGLLVMPLGPILAEEDLSSADFDSLYQGSKAQDPTNDNLDLNLESAIDGVVVPSTEPPDPLAADKMDDGRERSMDWAEEHGEWEVAPVMLGRRQDGQASDSDVLAPVGVEFVREF